MTGLTSDPNTCACRRLPWITIDMLGGVRPARIGGLPMVRCPDRDHCLRGAPIVNGHLASHWRNMDPPCVWTGIRVAPSHPCICGGWPWIQRRVIRWAFHEKRLDPHTPLRAADCPGCHKMIDIEKSRFTLHHVHRDEPCTWSGIYVALGSSVPPLGIAAPASIQA